MNKFISVFVVLAATLPLTAEAQQRLSEEQLIQLATEKDTCKGREVVGAKYDEKVANRVIITCGDDAEGFVPVAGLGLGGAGAAAAGLALVAAAGGGGSTPTTTTGTN
jgi:hypothetical protein